MTTHELLAFRLTNQQLIETKFKTPNEMVSWFGAVQAQDYPGAKWGVGQRLPGSTDATLEDAFTKGEILRTHVMRPTWHFVTPKDIRWLLKLTAPRVKQAMSSYNKNLELSDKVFTKTQTIITQLLEGNRPTTRQEIKSELSNHGIKTDVQRLAHIVMWAEQDGLICSGPIRGKQFTYMLLEERVPKTKELNYEESLAELTKRYFLSHGPATIRDFVWWSGLKTEDAKRGIEMVKLNKEIIDEKTYYFFPAKPLPTPSTTFLLPNYDEYGIAYTERHAFFDPEYNRLLNSRGNATFQYLIIKNGIMIGTWKKTVNKKSVLIENKFFNKVTAADVKDFKESAEQYGKFLNLSVILH